MAYLTLADPRFDRCVTLREAYEVMERFITAYVERGDQPSAVLLAYFGIAPDGCSGDPSALPEFLAAAERDGADVRAV